MTGLAVLTAADAGRLADLHAAAFDRPWDARAFGELIGAMGVATFGIEGETGLAGMIMVRAVAGEAEVLTLAVSPAARRQGLGLALVEAAVGTAAALGADTLWLEVAADNAAALALYRAAQFRVAGRRPAYYARPMGEKVDAVVMTRDLNTAAG
jgi:ribosomal-protein-alanine N-acetyltransferase